MEAWERRTLARGGQFRAKLDGELNSLTRELMPASNPRADWKLWFLQ
jgi:hypothetical protein